MSHVTIEDYYKAAHDLGAIVAINENIQPGDLYLAGRNTGIKLLTCKNIDLSGFINPIENEYAYDIRECIKIIDYKRI